MRAESEALWVTQKDLDKLLEDEETRFLWLFAGHLTVLAAEPVPPQFTPDKPKTLRFSLPGIEHIFVVEMWHREGGFTDAIWDQGMVDGRWAGNRHGIAKEFALRVARERKKA